MSSSGYTAWSVTAGEVPTTAYWNILGSNDASFNTGNGFNDGIINTRHLASGIQLAPAAQNPYKFSVYRAAAQTPGSGGRVQFDTKNFDTGGNVDIAITVGRFTATITGFYLFSCNLTYQVTAANQDVGFTWAKNNATINGGAGYVNMFAGTSNDATVSSTVLLSLVAGDFVDVKTNTGLALVVALANQCEFSGFLVSAT